MDMANVAFTFANSFAGEQYLIECEATKAKNTQRARFKCLRSGKRFGVIPIFEPGLNRYAYSR